MLDVVLQMYLLACICMAFDFNVSIQDCLSFLVDEQDAECVRMSSVGPIDLYVVRILLIGHEDTDVQIGIDVLLVEVGGDTDILNPSSLG